MGDDVAAVIEELKLVRPVLVGWSYGGFIMCDYLARYGARGISGLNFVGAAVRLTPTHEMLGAGFLENASGMASSDIGERIAAVRHFVRACAAQPLPQHVLETFLCFNISVPPEVKVAMAERCLDFSGLLSKLEIPVLVTQGLADDIVLPAMAEHIANITPHAEASFYEHVGHIPFTEATSRFNAELATFVRQATGQGQ